MNEFLYITGDFDDMGVAEGKIPEGFGEIKSLRLNIHVESENWAILSEVCIVISELM